MLESLFRSATLLKRDFNTGIFPVNIAKFLRSLFFAEQFRCLLLQLDQIVIQLIRD